MAVFSNQATLSYTGGNINSNIASGEITEALSATKTAVSASYSPDGTVSYAVSIVNAGTSDATGVSLTDDLGAALFEGQTVYPLQYVDGSLLFFLDGVQGPAPTVAGGPPLSVSGITVPAGSSVMLIYEARVSAFAPLGPDAAITNTITVTGDCIVTPLTDSASIPMQMAPRLSIAKSVSPEVVTGCSELSYTFVIQNSGSEAGAEAAVVITDVFDPILSDLRVTLDGAPMARAAYSYDETTGTFSTAAGQLSVPGAVFTQNADGSWMTTPGITVLTVSGTI